MNKTILALLLVFTLSFSIPMIPPVLTFTDDTDIGDQTDDTCHVGIIISGAEVEEDDVLIFWDGDESGIPFDECVITDESMICTIDIPVSSGEHTFEVCATERFGGLTACTPPETVDFGSESSGDTLIYSITVPSSGGADANSQSNGSSDICLPAILILAFICFLMDKRKKRKR